MASIVKFALILLLVSSMLSCQKQFLCPDCKVNQPPIANAGLDQKVILPKDSSVLDGSGSTDPDNNITSYKWTKISWPSTFKITDATTIQATVTSLQQGVYQFELQVTDALGLFSKDTVQVLVDDPLVNQPPIAYAGPDQTIISPVNSTVLDGRGFDPDNNISSYTWTKISGPLLFTIANSNAAQTQISNLQLGFYIIELTVTDAGGLFSKDTMKLIVRAVPNLPPIADAGPNITLHYNLQNCTLDPSFFNIDGRGSRDPDGTVDHYQWSLIQAENDAVTITNPNAAIATISNLTPGNYVFKLQVTDNEGATDDDTVFVNTVYTFRPTVSARLIPIGSLSETRKVSVVATVDNKIFFAGGRYQPAGPGPNFSSRVDIYDISNNSWSTAELSQPRWGMTAATMGTKIFFSGGTALQSTVGPTSRIDVYDASGNTWSTMEMPRKGGAGQFSSIVISTKLFLAGGNSIDIYDDRTKLWSNKNLSQPRYLISTTNIGGKLFFAGGVTDITSASPTSRVDIYSLATNSWSVSELSKPKFGMGSIALRGKIFWAGGTTLDNVTNEVEILDVMNSAGTAFSCLFQPNTFNKHSVGMSNNKIVFFVGEGKVNNKFDIYDPLTDTWSVGVLDQSITPSLIISVNNNVYVVGSLNNEYHDTVWKLEF